MMIAILAMAGAVATAEAYLRAFDPQELITPGMATRFGLISTWLPYRSVRHRTPDFDVAYSINDIGFRRRRWSTAKPPGLKRLGACSSAPPGPQPPPSANSIRRKGQREGA